MSFPSNNITVFDIPLLMDLICQNLHSRDIRQCSLVCRNWNSSFSPYLWQHISISRKHNLKRFRTQDSVQALKHHAPLVRSITTCYSDVFRWMGDNPPLNRKERKYGPCYTTKIRGTGSGRTMRKSKANKEHYKDQHQHNDGPLSLRHLSLSDQDKETTVTTSTGLSRTTMVAEKTISPANCKPLLWSQPLHGLFTPKGDFQPFLFTNLTVIRCHNLTEKTSIVEANMSHLDRLLDIIETLPRLCVLELNQFRFLDQNVARLCTVVGDHPTLKDLTINTKRTLYYIDFRRILKHCTRLERLKFGCSFLAGPKKTNQGSVPTQEDRDYYASAPQSNLKELDLGGVSLYWDRELIIDAFFKVCGGLERIVAPRHMHSENFLRVIREDLKYLRYLDVHQGLVDINGIAALIKTVPILEGFKGPEAHYVNDGTIKALMGHRSTLKEVKLDSCYNVTGRQVQQFLTSCPNLVWFQVLDIRHRFYKAFRDPTIHVHDIEENSLPWTCLGLKVLALQFAPTEREVFPRVIYERIGELVQLEELYLSRYLPPQSNDTVAPRPARFIAANSAATTTTAAAVAVPTSAQVPASIYAMFSSTVSTGPHSTTQTTASMPSSTTVDGTSANNDYSSNNTVDDGGDVGADDSEDDGNEDEDEKRGDKNLEQVVKMCLGLQKLRTLDLTNLYQYIYHNQLIDLKKGIPGLRFVDLY